VRKIWDIPQFIILRLLKKLKQIDRYKTERVCGSVF